MTDERSQINRLQTKPKRELKAILKDELGSSYDREITSSLRNDFMRACFLRIAPDENPSDRVKDHPNYSSTWEDKRSLATALRMLLTERVDHPEFDGITSLTKTLLAEIIVAIRESERSRP